MDYNYIKKIFTYLLRFAILISSTILFFRELGSFLSNPYSSSHFLYILTVFFYSFSRYWKGTEEGWPSLFLSLFLLLSMVDIYYLHTIIPNFLFYFGVI